MDVTPYARSDTLSGASGMANRSSHGDVVKSFNKGIAKEPQPDIVSADPVRRAEAAIGGLFTDSRYPTARFSIDRDDESGRYVYRLIDSHTNEVIKQFPGDYVLRRVAYYPELQGIAVNSEA